jgi:hypothetical protein
MLVIDFVVIDFDVIRLWSEAGSLMKVSRLRRDVV